MKKRKVIFLEGRSWKYLLDEYLKNMNIDIEFLDIFNNKRGIFKRGLVNVYFFYKLLISNSKSVIFCPWGSFWIPSLLNMFLFKKFYIVSITCDTFISEKNKKDKNKSFINLLKYNLCKLTYKKINKFFYCSDVVKNELIKFGIPETKLYSKYREWIRDNKRYEKSKNIKINLDKKGIIFVGHYYFSLQKRVDILVDSFNKLKKEDKYSDWKLHIIGDGWKKFFGKNMTNYLEKNGVIFYGNKSDWFSILKECSILAHPGDLEGFGTSVIEGMLTGIIPLVSNKTGCCEIIKEINPELVVNLDSESFYNGLKKIIGMKKENKEKLSKNIKKISLEYNYKNSVKELSDDIKKLLFKI